MAGRRPPETCRPGGNVAHGDPTVAGRAASVGRPAQPAAMVELPAPMPVIQASAGVAESEATLPTIAPIHTKAGIAATAEPVPSPP